MHTRCSWITDDSILCHIYINTRKFDSFSLHMNANVNAIRTCSIVYPFKFSTQLPLWFLCNFSMNFRLFPTKTSNDEALHHAAVQMLLHSVIFVHLSVKRKIPSGSLPKKNYEQPKYETKCSFWNVLDFIIKIALSVSLASKINANWSK